MRIVGIEAIYTKVKTSKPGVGHRIYPYLLRGLLIDRVHQVWATDITYIPVRTGFMYLMAIMDPGREPLYSRYVLKWSISNTMATNWCCQVFAKTLATHPAPEIFNTDQGSQFTSDAFTTLLLKAEIRVSMDSKGRALDNTLVAAMERNVFGVQLNMRTFT
jgi:putative transposase